MATPSSFNVAQLSMFVQCDGDPNLLAYIVKEGVENGRIWWWEKIDS